MKLLAFKIWLTWTKVKEYWPQHVPNLEELGLRVVTLLLVEIVCFPIHRNDFYWSELKVDFSNQ